MTVAHTSRQAYHSLDLAPMQQKVFDFIKDNPGCDDRYISEETGLERNNVCGRRNELVNLGLIEYVGDGVSITGKRTKRYKVKEEYL